MPPTYSRNVNQQTLDVALIPSELDGMMVTAGRVVPHFKDSMARVRQSNKAGTCPSLTIAQVIGHDIEIIGHAILRGGIARNESQEQERPYCGQKRLCNYYSNSMAPLTEEDRQPIFLVFSGFFRPR